MQSYRISLPLNRKTEAALRPTDWASCTMGSGRQCPCYLGRVRLILRVQQQGETAPLEQVREMNQRGVHSITDTHGTHYCPIGNKSTTIYPSRCLLALEGRAGPRPAPRPDPRCKLWPARLGRETRLASQSQPRPLVPRPLLHGVRH
jgi:hypothetical protein